MSQIFGPVTNIPPFEPPRFFSAKSGPWQQLTINEFSDGERRFWPEKPYRPTNETAYLCRLAYGWAEKLGSTDKNMNYYLNKLPDGFALFEIDQPGKEPGQVYKRLWGHSSGRFFDSILRFQLHFLWLMDGMQGDCGCLLCNNDQGKVFVKRQRKPKTEDFEIKSRIRRTAAEILGESDSTRSSSTDALAGSRVRRLPRNVVTSYPIDEEGTKDVYKECLAKLYKNRGSTKGIEDDIIEEDSIDHRAERKSLQILFTQLAQQHSFVPRLGELVLWCNYFPDDHYLMPDPETGEFKFYSYKLQCFHGFPDWRGGVITSTPTSIGVDGPIDFPDILDIPNKKYSLNTSGFRVETMPDPNDDEDKSLSKQYKYLPLRNIRPLAQWQRLLYGFPQKKMHVSVLNVLKCMTTVSLIDRFKFTGDWPNASIHCHAIYIGSELITVGDVIRFSDLRLEDKSVGNASKQLNPITNILVVTSIRLNLNNIELDHIDETSPLLSNSSSITVVGNAYTSDPFLADRADYRARSWTAIDEETAKSLFRPVGTCQYAPKGLYPIQAQHQRYEISFERVLGRLYEADAVKMWSGQSQSKAKASKPPDLDWDLPSIIAGRIYASKHDRRVGPGSKQEIRWYWTDTRAHSLGVQTINGEEVGEYDTVRDQRTLRSWRAQLKILRGDLSDMKDTYLPSRKGRQSGARLVDGKTVYPSAGHDANDEEEEDDKRLSQSFGATSITERRKSRAKSSSQMMQAAQEITDDDTEDDGEEAVPTGETTEDEDELEPNSDELLDLRRTNPHRKLVEENTSEKAKSGSKTKQQIMKSIEADPEMSEHNSEDEFAFLNEPVPIRGGTEESEGGDYNPTQDREREESGSESGRRAEKRMKFGFGNPS